MVTGHPRGRGLGGMRYAIGGAVVAWVALMAFWLRELFGADR